MTARVVFTAGFSRRYTGGVREFTVEARNLRGVIKEMDKLYPGLGHHLEEETTVAIDGQIHKTAYFQPIRSARFLYTGQDRRQRERTITTAQGELIPVSHIPTEEAQIGAAHRCTVRC
jgi:molybdopterin synthase sulfur carrier subunit